MTREGSQGRRSLLGEIALVVAVLAVYLAWVTPTLDRPLTGWHSFRQTQTAYTARIFSEEGIDLLHPKLPVLGEPFEVPFEFPLFQAAASTVIDAGVGDDLAMRLTAVGCFLLTALLLYGLMRRVAGRPSALATLVVFVLSPFGLVWGRASTIEYLATAGAVGFAWATIVWRESGRPLPGALALIAGLVGMLVKPTTAVFWLLPALGYRPTARDDRSVRLGRMHAVGTTALFIVPIAAAAVWTRHADRIKASSPTTAWLTSRRLEDWNFGTLGQRIDPALWDVLRDWLPNVVGLAAIFLPVAVIAIWNSAQRWFWLGIAAAAVLPLLVFTNLYLVHDYYLAAVSPALAALIGLGAGYVWELVPRRALLVGCAVAGALLLMTASLVHFRGYLQLISAARYDGAVQPLARELRANTDAGDRVLFDGLDWSPAVPYYANRWGVMAAPKVQQAAYDLARRNDYRYVLVANPPEQDPTMLARWSWVSSLAPHLYGVAQSAEELPAAEFSGTSDAADDAHGRRLAGPLAVRCGIPGPVLVPAGQRETWIRVATPNDRVHVRASGGLAPLPARRWLHVGQGLASDGRIPLACTGTDRLVVEIFG